MRCLHALLSFVSTAASCECVRCGYVCGVGMCAVWVCVRCGWVLNVRRELEEKELLWQRANQDKADLELRLHQALQRLGPLDAVLFPLSLSLSPPLPLPLPLSLSTPTPTLTPAVIPTPSSSSLQSRCLPLACELVCLS